MWQFREDREGKGVGWIATEPTSQGAIGVASEIGRQLQFPIKMERGLLQVGYLFAYDNMAKVELSLGVVANGKVTKVGSTHTIESLVVDRTSGYKGDTIDFSNELMAHSSAWSAEGAALVVALRHLRPTLAPGSNTSCPPRGENKFKLLSIKAY